MLSVSLLFAGCAKEGDVGSIRAKAEQGDVEAQVALAEVYLEGRGVPVDYVEAAKWYRKAAEQGDASAQTNLGTMYERGLGVPQDYTESAQWYRKAADQGVSAARFQLGMLYRDGKGVPQDQNESFNWAKLAAEGRGIPAGYRETMRRQVMGRTNADVEPISLEELNKPEVIERNKKRRELDRRASAVFRVVAPPPSP